MDGINDIINLAQGGAVVLLVAAVVALWRRLNAVTDRFTSYLEESAKRGDVAAQKVLNGSAAKAGSGD